MNQSLFFSDSKAILIRGFNLFICKEHQLLVQETSCLEAVDWGPLI